MAKGAKKTKATPAQPSTLTMRQKANKARKAADQPLSDRSVRRAKKVVERSGLGDLCDRHVQSEDGRSNHHNFSSLLAVMLLAGWRGEGVLYMTNMELHALALTKKQAKKLGITKKMGYHHFDYALGCLTKALTPVVDHDTGEITTPLGIAHAEFATRLVSATVPNFLQAHTTVALDSTDVESPYRRRSRSANGTPDVDALHAPVTSAQVSTGRNEKHWPRTGSDGRLQHTSDPDAREGWRTPKESNWDTFLGYDLHVAVPVPDLGGAAVPSVALGVSVEPAGNSKTTGGLGALDYLPTTPERVLCDRGYSYRKDWAPNLRARSIKQSIDLHSNQRGQKVGPRPKTLRIYGGIYSDALPASLRKLPAHSAFDTDAQRAALAEKYDLAQRYAFKFWQVTPGGKVRFRGPALTKQVRCVNNPSSMRLPVKGNPTTACKKGQPCGCSTTMTLDYEEFERTHQTNGCGTTAWVEDYYRRSQVEGLFGHLKQNFAKFDRGCVRTIGTIKNSVMVALILAGMNLNVVSDFYGMDWLQLVELDEAPLLAVELKSGKKPAAHRGKHNKLSKT